MLKVYWQKIFLELSSGSFCAECGYRFPGPVKFCPNCGMPVRAGVQSHNLMETEPNYYAQKPLLQDEKPVQYGVMESAEVQEAKKTQQAALQRKLEYYRDKLLQVGRQNRSIVLRRIYDKWCFDLARLAVADYIRLDEDAVIESALVSKNYVCLVPDSDSSEQAQQDRARIKSLYRNTRQIEQETGLDNTYLGFPFLVGHVAQDTFVRAPLVLFPVSIEHKQDEIPWMVCIVFKGKGSASKQGLAGLHEEGYWLFSSGAVL